MIERECYSDAITGIDISSSEKFSKWCKIAQSFILARIQKLGEARTRNSELYCSPLICFERAAR